MSINVSVGVQIPTNVVEVGNEITADQLAAIYWAFTPSQTNPFLTTDAADFLPLAGGNMTGGIVFDTTGLQNINKGTFDNSLGGYNGISLTCAVGYELNWQGGHLSNWYSGAYQPIYLDSPIVVTAINSNTNIDITFDAYNDTGAGTHFLHTFDAATGKLNLATNGGGLTFPDGTIQTVAGYPNTNPNGYITSASGGQPALKGIVTGSGSIDGGDNYYIYVIGSTETLTIDDEATNDPPIGTEITVVSTSTMSNISCSGSVTCNGSSGFVLPSHTVLKLVKIASNTWWIG